MNQYGFCDYPTYTIEQGGQRGICGGCGRIICNSEMIEASKKGEISEASQQAESIYHPEDDQE